MFRRSCFASLLALLFLAASAVEGTRKIWSGPTNAFDDKNNWVSGVIPCSADSIQFDSTWTPTTVYIQKNFTVKSLEFPLDGSLILDSELSIEFDPDDTACNGHTGQTTIYKGQDPGDWDNPKNWKSVNDQNAEISTSTLADIDSLPCEADSVVFPSKTAVAVRLTHPVTVSGVQIDSTALNQASLNQYMSSYSGKGQFKLPSAGAITITGTSCKSSPCDCLNTGRNALRAACSYLGTCPVVSLYCQQPVMLSGDCCAYCGGLINATTDGTFSRTTFEQQVKAFLKGQPFKTHVVSQTLVQVLVYGQNGDSIATQLMTNIKTGPSPYTLPSTPTVTFAKSIARSLSPVTVTPKVIYVTDKGGNTVTNEHGHAVTVPCKVEGNTDKSTGSSSSDSLPWIVAGIFGALLLVLIILVIVYAIRRRSSEEEKDTVVPVSHKMSTLSANPLVVNTEEGDYETIGINPGFDNPTYTRGAGPRY